MNLEIETLEQEISRINQDIKHLKRNRISREMIRNHPDLYPVSKELKAMVDEQRSLETKAIKTWIERRKALKSLLTAINPLNP